VIIPPQIRIAKFKAFQIPGQSGVQAPIPLKSTTAGLFVGILLTGSLNHGHALTQENISFSKLITIYSVEKFFLGILSASSLP
jgi:hypothetical protein